MEGKKRYIAIILFLLICLMLFTFATTGDEELEAGKGNGNDIQEVTNKGDSDKDEEKDSDSEKEESNDQSSSSTGSSNNGNSNAGDDEDLDGTGNTDNSAWDKALAAVEELEKVLTDDQLNIARELVEEITNSDQYKELIERVEDAEDAIDATALVEALEKMVEEAAKREDIEDASDFRDDEVLDAVNEIDGEYLEEVKEDLLDRIEKLNKILDDATAPKVEGIEDGDTTKKDVELTITDDNEVTTTVTKDGQTYEYVEKFTEEGTYELTVVDSAFNETKLTFTIDKTAPKFIEPKNGSHYTSIEDIKVEDATEVTVVIKNQDTGKEVTAPLTEDATYYITATDAAGNSKSIYVAIDNTYPVINGVDETKPTNKNEIVYVSDKFLTKVIIDGKEYTRSDFEVGEKNENFKFQKKITKEGTHTVVAIDKFGNETTKTFVIDKTAAKVKSSDFYVHGLTAVEKVFYTQKGNKITVNVKVNEQLANVPTFTLHSNGKDYVLTDVLDRGENAPGVWLYQASYVIEDSMADGEVTFTISNIVDKAGNVTADVTAPTNGRRVIVDNTAPKAENLAILGGKGYWVGKEYKQYATNGTIVYVNVRMYEELATTPVVTLNDTVTLTKATKKESNGVWIYSYSYRLKENDGIADGVLQVKVTNIADLAGNSIELTNADCKMESQSEVTVDRTAPSYKFYKEGSSLDKDEIQPTIIDGKLYFNQNVRVVFEEANSHFTQYIHNDFVNNEDKTNITSWTREAKNDGEHTMKVTDAAGNVTEVTFTVDTTAPTYKFYKEGSSLAKDEIQPTIIDGKLYFNQNVRVVFEEANSHFTQYIHNDFVNNENKTTITSWTREAKNDGEHTMKVTDALGHVTEVTFTIDTKAPTLTVKEESIGTDPIYSKVSFKLYDDNKVDYVLVNGNKFDVGNAQWSDANYGNIKKYLVEGENTIVLYDVAGNSTEMKITMDWTAPTVESQYRTDLADKRTDVIGSDAHNIVFTIYKDNKLVHTVDAKSNYKRFSIDWLGDGVYKVVVTDIAGLSSKITVTIDHTAPVVTPSYTELTVEGDKNATFNQFPTFEIEDLTEVKTELISGEVNMGKVGEYTLTYKFTDEFNNSSTQDVVVKVVDTTAPVVTAKADSVVYVEYGTSYTELGAIVKDNIDEDRELTKPSYINLYELGENNATGPFVRRLGENEIVDPNVIGKYLLVYTATDAAGNASNNQLPESKIWVIVRDTTAPTFRFTKAGSSLVKDEIQPTLVDGVYYFNQPVRVTISDSLNLRLHGVNSYYDDNNPNRTGWLTDLYEDGEYTAVGVDSFNNRAEFKFVIYIPREENKQINISKDITLQNTPFFNEVDSTGVTINGNGHTVTQNVTDPSLFTWYDLNNKVRPLMGNMFATKAGEKITINDLTFAGTTQYIALGQYRGSTYTTYSTELNNVNVIGLNIVSYSTNPQIAAAVITYGANTVLNNTNIYNTKMSSMDPHGHKIYDFAVVNYTNTTINGGKIGTIYTWANANLTIKGATVGTIDSKIITGTKNRKLLIEAGSIVDRINVVNNDVYTPGLVIKNGATVKELNISKITKSQKIVIENGATIEKVITADSELTLEEAVNNGLLVIS